MITQSYQSVKTNANRMIAIIEVALIVIGLFIYSQLPPGGFSDGLERFRAVTAIINGKMPHTAYSIIGPAFYIPLWFLGKLYQSPLWWAGQYNKIVFVAGMCIMYWLLKDYLSPSLLRKFMLILLVASMFGHNVVYFGGESFTAMCVAAGIIVVVKGCPVAGWAAIVLGVANTPASIVGLVGIVLFLILKTRRWRYLLAVVAAAGLIMAEAWIRRGSPFNSGYMNQTFSTPFFFGLIAILFSFGKGLVFFTPGLLLPMKKKLLEIREETKLDVVTIYALWISFVVGLVLVYSSWWAWDGGWFWGPRFFLFACIPASFAIAVYLERPATSLLLNVFALIVLCLSLWVGIDGVLFSENALVSTCVHHGSLRYSLCQFNPYYSVLWHPFTVHAPLTLHTLFFAGYSMFTAFFIAIPLLRTIAQQLVEKAQVFSKAYRPLKGWHY